MCEFLFHPLAMVLLFQRERLANESWVSIREPLLDPLGMTFQLI
jgi:hypothetical protein